jgi:hypothetical protein
MAQALIRCVCTSETQIRSHASTCGIYGGQSGTETVFSPRRLVASCPYHSTIVPTHLLSSCFFYRQDQRTKPVNLEIKQCYSRNGEHWKEKDFHWGRGRVCFNGCPNFCLPFLLFPRGLTRRVCCGWNHSLNVLSVCSRSLYGVTWYILMSWKDSEARDNLAGPSLCLSVCSVVTHYPMPRLLWFSAGSWKGKFRKLPPCFIRNAVFNKELNASHASEGYIQEPLAVNLVWFVEEIQDI